MSAKSWMAVVAIASGFAQSARTESPGTSSYWLHEQHRRLAIADQIGTQEHLRWFSGLSSRFSSGRPYSLESIYSGLAYSPGPPAPWKTDVFEPWPFVPGDIYGRQFDPPLAQPRGHVVTPTGPNGYTYAPVYDAPAPMLPIPVLPQERPLPRPTPPPRANVEEIPAPRPTNGNQELREF